VRGHAAEIGGVAPLGGNGLTELRAEIAAADDAAVPAAAKQAIAPLGREAERIEARLRVIDAQLMEQHKANPVRRRLAAIPGIGPIGALSWALPVEAAQFASARHFAAWLGLVPRECSTAGKQRLGGISRAGDERLRQLLVLGATAVIQGRDNRPDTRPQPHLSRIFLSHPLYPGAVHTPYAVFVVTRGPRAYSADIRGFAVPSPE
jgi:transposase